RGRPAREDRYPSDFAHRPILEELPGRGAGDSVMIRPSKSHKSQVTSLKSDVRRPTGRIAVADEQRLIKVPTRKVRALAVRILIGERRPMDLSFAFVTNRAIHALNRRFLRH